MNPAIGLGSTQSMTTEWVILLQKSNVHLYKLLRTGRSVSDMYKAEDITVEPSVTNYVVKCLQLININNNYSVKKQLKVV